MPDIERLKRDLEQLEKRRENIEEAINNLDDNAPEEVVRYYEEQAVLVNGKIKQITDELGDAEARKEAERIEEEAEQQSALARGYDEAMATGQFARLPAVLRERYARAKEAEGARKLLGR
jgi:hypothetical protein